MNLSASPCENFYEYACGQWNRDHQIPDDMFAYGTFAYLKEDIFTVLLESDTPTPSRSIQMAKQVYKSCMNTTELENLKSSKLLEAISVLGGWPLLKPETWDEKSFDLTALVSKAQKLYSIEVLFSLSIYPDMRNTTRSIIYIDQGSLGLGRGSREYFLNASVFGKQLEAYINYQRKAVELIMTDANVKRSSEDLDKDLKELIDFEKKFALIFVPEENRRNNTRLYNKATIASLSTYLPQIDWLRFFKSVSPKPLHNYLTNNTEVVICELEYLSDVSKLLNQTESRIVVNYLLWRIATFATKLLDSRYENIKQDFSRVMTGQQAKSPRWKDCAQTPTGLLPFAAGALYVREHFDSEDKKEAMEMIGNLREAFKDLVRENDWMDAQTKSVAIEKVDNMINYIGYPDFINNDTKLDKYHEKLVFMPNDTYFDLLLRVIWWTNEREFLKLLKPYDKYEFEISPAVVNAFYSPEKNGLSFPAGILKPPFFSGIYPKQDIELMVNYGGIGAVIGHEITHGFDDQGSQFDKDGNLRNWWNEDSYRGFAERKQCMIEQYSSYTLPDTDIRVNGKLTQGENIADNGGVKEAYRAYRKYVKQHGEEGTLPGFENFSNEQIFFLSYAHFWCGHKKEAAAMQQISTDEHSPEIFRVIGVLSNLEEFSEAFKCSKGSPLNPDKRCVVW
ncbi:unnamed protein product [Enterobius vermicularis]|uniref:Neprilysin n=1 Tax=Enterobius vermicularis TaxID=51028 RepID=A0A0N4VE24_ENTVE|nr:unnamed protein product [Enterobius vermicularis]